MSNVWNVCPETPPPRVLDRSGRLAWLSSRGYPQLAADTILTKGTARRLEEVVGNAIRHLNLEFLRSRSSRGRCYETLIEVALNLVGMEGRRAGFSTEESEQTLREIIEVVGEWERKEREDGEGPAVRDVVQRMLQGMKKVLRGEGMVAKMAEEIEGKLDPEHLAESFVLASRNEIQGNVYYKIVEEGLSKLGNDSATGLRWLRHLGAVQVSSNPVIAARAYEELPEMWQKFGVVVASHPEWHEDPQRFGDEIAMLGTIVALLPNLLDFRPIALLSDFHEGMVSIQLNPYKAGGLEGSVADALRIYGIAQEILEEYDIHLMGDADFEGRGRPNVVFKVAGADPAAIKVTEGLDAMGIGTNNTVTYTVSQEITLAMAAMRGLANARKMGIPNTRVYITNMEGRLEDHLREAEAARLLRESLEKGGEAEARIGGLAERVGVAEEVKRAGTIEEKLAVLCAKKNLKTLAEDWFVAAVGDREGLVRMENEIRWAGILVTRRVFGVAFGPASAEKWARHIQTEMGLAEEKAREVVSMVDLLPSSKRRAEDTYQVLGGRDTANLTNTEFPDQQVKVWTGSRERGFRLSEFEGSIAAQPDPAVLKRLLEIRDFRLAYQLTSDLSRTLSKIGIAVEEDGGLPPELWASYGPAMKTMREFKGAYMNFKNKVMSFVAEAGTIKAPVGNG